MRRQPSFSVPIITLSWYQEQVHKNSIKLTKSFVFFPAMAGDDVPPPPPLKLDSSSPFFLGPQDRPGDFITPTRLTHDNYADWAVDIRLALLARRKFSFVDGSISSPTPPCTESDWLTLHTMLVSWITNTITPEVKSTLTTYLLFLLLKV